MNRLIWATAVLGTMLVGTAFAADVAKVQVNQDEKFGSYLADANGVPFYLFTADKQGQSGTTATSACEDKCATAWPPAIAGADKPAAGEKVGASLLSSFDRKDGTKQITYNGWPLYFFSKDVPAGAPTAHSTPPTGQGKTAFGGEWYLVTPDGKKDEQGAGNG